ncbi:hypothetical protein Tsubulata_032573 [Turnera subulata]|uniref:H15 domain-containing protein n=1 Tax=Turnera subulata TaxID=218843 RepID=A0A9Q0FNQ1_9ROSI|nr:hypothetical protein Tsubulata_032573 [Turnera subulata]
MSRKSSSWNCEFGMASPGENHYSPTNTTTSTPENIDQRQQRTLQMLKDATLETARNTLHRPLSMQEQARLDARLVNLIPEILSRSRPDHPPYAEMIYEAINSLREEAGSSQASISSFIKSHHPDLPWAHETFLSHHLNRLTLKGGQITKTKNGHYMFFRSNPYQKDINQEKEGEEMPIFLVEPPLEEVKRDKNKRRRSRKVKNIEEKDVVKKGHAAKVEAVVMGLAKVQNEAVKKLRGGPSSMEEEKEWEVEKPKIPREEHYCLRRR